MNKPLKYALLVIASVGIMGVITPSYAAVMAVLVGTGSGNDDLAAVQALAPEITELDAKIDVPDDGTPPPYTADGMTGTYTIDSGGPTGNWETTGDFVHWYSIKAGPNFALYHSAGGLTSDMWDTSVIPNRGGNAPDLSHISFWKPTSPVPEPSQYALLAAGIGLGILARKKQKEQNSVA